MIEIHPRAGQLQTTVAQGHGDLEDAWGGEWWGAASGKGVGGPLPSRGGRVVGGRPKMEFPMLHLLFRHLLKMLTNSKMCHRIKTCQFRELGRFGRSNKPQNLS